MSKPLFRFIILSVVCCFYSSCKTTSNAGIEEDIQQHKNALILYLQEVIADSLVISGQHCGNGNATAQGYEAYVEGLHQKTGKYPALIGLEYGYSAGNDLSLINSYALKHSQAGGIVTITWHADNPWIEGYNCRWNSEENKHVINFNLLLKDAPESLAKSNYRTELTKVGHAIAELRDAGIVVFWRPFHEMNGNWFWWGPDHIKAPTNNDDYVLLWKDMFDTFTSDLGLNNLIWIYSPMLKAEWTSPLNTFYPGDDVVDLVGVDIYSTIPEFTDYEALKTMGKPIVIGEIGPVKESYGKYDALDVLNALSGKAAWFLQWSSWTNAHVAIVDNPNATEMMNHPSTVTLDKIKASLEN